MDRMNAWLSDMTLLHFQIFLPCLQHRPMDGDAGQSPSSVFFVKCELTKQTKMVNMVNIIPVILSTTLAFSSKHHCASVQPHRAANVAADS